jgi:hypothetical protein
METEASTTFELRINSMKAPRDAITKLDEALPGAPSLHGNFDEQLVTTHISNRISTPALLNRGGAPLSPPPSLSPRIQPYRRTIPFHSDVQT